MDLPDGRTTDRQDLGDVRIGQAFPEDPLPHHTRGPEKNDFHFATTLFRFASNSSQRLKRLSSLACSASAFFCFCCCLWTSEAISGCSNFALAIFTFTSAAWMAISMSLSSWISRVVRTLGASWGE